MPITITLIIAISLVNILCFLIGARVGQKVQKQEEIKLPELNPVKLHQEYREKKEQEAKRDRLETILGNIDGYDGTEHGQTDIPGR